MMPTTIQVKERNLRLLEQLKRSMGARSYDEVIGRLLEEKLGTRGSMFGALRGKISSFEERDRLEEEE
jgi:predicted CopG family antitoxin